MTQFVSVLFIIPIIVDIHGHRFEIYNLVLEIYKNVDLVLGIKNIFQLEYVINSWVLKPKEQRLIKVEAPFMDEISGLAIIKALDKNTQNTMMHKLKFVQTSATLDIIVV